MFQIRMEEAPYTGLLTKVLLIVYVYFYFWMLIGGGKTKKAALLFTGPLLGVI